jgi:DNA-directed RNA polymerase subunit F
MAGEDSMVPGKYVSLSEVKVLVEAEQEIREDLAYEQKLALDQAIAFTRVPAEQVEELVEKLTAVSDKVTPWHAYKMVDIGPTHPDDIRAIFQKDRITPESDEIDKIIDIIKGYL